MRVRGGTLHVQYTGESLFLTGNTMLCYKGLWRYKMATVTLHSHQPHKVTFSDRHRKMSIPARLETAIKRANVTPMTYARIPLHNRYDLLQDNDLADSCCIKSHFRPML